jgi:hypothetical protein
MANSGFIFGFFIGLIIFSCGWMFMSELINFTDGQVNNLENNHMFYANAASHYSTIKWFAGFLPYVFFLGTIVWCFELAKGTNIDSTTFFSYIVMLIIGYAGSLFLTFAIGATIIPASNYVLSILPSQAMNASDLFQPIISSAMDAINFIIMASWYVAEFPIVVASFVFMVFPIILQLSSNNSMISFGGSGGNDDESITNLQGY